MMRTQLWVGAGEPTAANMRPITAGRLWVKPQGGLWTSTWDARSRTAAWMEYVREEYPSWPRARCPWWLLTPDPAARIYVVDSPIGLHRLIATYPAESARTFALPAVDWEAMAARGDYDAVHLTDRGERMTRLTFPESLYGWDCESTLWLRWCFVGVSAIEHGASEEAT